MNDFINKDFTEKELFILRQIIKEKIREIEKLNKKEYKEDNDNAIEEMTTILIKLDKY